MPGSSCTECLHLRDRAARCTPTVVDSAAFGKLELSYTPYSCAVQRQCAVFAADPACSGGGAVLSRLNEACDGKQYCLVNLTASSFPTPSGCPSAASLQLAVRASGCSQGTAIAGFREQLAGFLLARGPHAWMGHGWIAGAHPIWYPEWDVDFGEPIAPPRFDGNVISRQWSKFNVSLDCGTFEAGFAPL